uniref:ISXO2-like transposase domain-containing protein n=1 Tax=Octopus bimaculoides TaxID=37653 RepID=A0A0L8FXA9_OCTBM
MVLVHRKHQCSRIVKTVWLFGGLERLSKKAFVVPLLNKCGEADRQDAETLTAHITRYIRQGSIIYNECWHAYSNLNNLGYTHYQVNNSHHFVDPVNPSVHTKYIECSWGTLKKSIIRPGMST